MKRIGLVVLALLGGLLTYVAAPAQAAVAPTTSPAAAVRYYSAGGDFVCESGYACATVPYGSGKYVFKFYSYGTYYLSNWTGTGTAANNQTGGAAMRLRDSGGAQRQCIKPPGTPPGQWTATVGWGPVYRIQLTAAAC